MSDASNAVTQLNTKMDKALATVLATPSADDRYFIGEALLIGTVLFVLNRYAGAYLDELGLKALAKDHAEGTRKLLAGIHSKTVTEEDIAREKGRLDQAFVAIRTRGASPPAERAADGLNQRKFFCHKGFC